MPRDELCSECLVNPNDDGEGYDGKCGACADREVNEAEVNCVIAWVPDNSRSIHPIYDVLDWTREIMLHNVRLSYVNWVNCKLEAEYQAKCKNFTIIVCETPGLKGIKGTHNIGTYSAVTWEGASSLAIDQTSEDWDMREDKLHVLAAFHVDEEGALCVDNYDEGAAL